MSQEGDASTVDETAAVRRAQQGDMAAFGELVELHQRAIFNVCYRLMGERRAAEDMSQEAFLRAFDRLHQFDPTRNLLPWLRRVATNVCLNTLERDKRLVFSLDDETAAEPPADDVLRPDVAAARRQAAADVHTALASLPPHYRAVIELCHFQDLSYAEAAEVLRLPLSDVKSHLFRARRRLARLLEDA